VSARVSRAARRHGVGGRGSAGDMRGIDAPAPRPPSEPEQLTLL
jgi:hypothetical protein